MNRQKVTCLTSKKALRNGYFDAFTLFKLENRVKESKMADDLRRLGKIEVQQDGPGAFRLTINGVLWAAVEWSGSKSHWCVGDAVERCVVHVQHVIGETWNAEKAIRMAKQMIRDGRMPSPEQAREQQEAEEREVVEEDSRVVMVPLTGLDEPMERVVAVRVVEERREPVVLSVKVEGSNEDAP